MSWNMVIYTGKEMPNPCRLIGRPRENIQLQIPRETWTSKNVVFKYIKYVTLDAVNGMT